MTVLTKTTADAVSRKRGPKTDILQELLKRVDGLERRLTDETQNNASKEEPSDLLSTSATENAENTEFSDQLQRPKLEKVESSNGVDASESAVSTPPSPSGPSPAIGTDILLDIYFARVHGKIYFILDEGLIRGRIRAGTAPNALLLALYAVSARYALHPNGYDAAVRLSEDYATRAWTEVDVGEPSIETLQTLLLLAISFTASGKGKKAYMVLGKLFYVLKKKKLLTSSS